MTYYTEDLKGAIYRYRKSHPEKIKAIHQKSAAKYYLNNKEKFHMNYLYKAECKKFGQMYAAFETDSEEIAGRQKALGKLNSFFQETEMPKSAAEKLICFFQKSLELK